MRVGRADFYRRLLAHLEARGWRGRTRIERMKLV
jgi:hypothetical protein